jgi:1-deoxy-D-xylulose-5-phosphate synthase
MSVGVVNARFAKPIDKAMVAQTLADDRFVVTLEEGTTVAGFGSAFLEEANSQGLDTRKIKRLALPDTFVEHGERADLLAQSGLHTQGIAQACQQWSSAPANS